MTEENREGRNRYIFPCPRCGKQHCSDSAIFDDRVSCSCGFDFYAFACGDLRIVMPWDEASYEPIARALRKFVVATGRCQDIPPELYDDPFDCIPVLEEDIERAFISCKRDHTENAISPLKCLLRSATVSTADMTLRSKGRRTE